jgi:hypothetical protein
MNDIDIYFLVAFLVVLAGMIGSSRVLRAVLCETLLHPLTVSRIIIHQDRVDIQTGSPNPKTI